MSKPLSSDILLELHVPDFAPAKDFYGSLGYEVVWEKPSIEGISYMVMRNGNSILNFYGGTKQVYEHDHFKQFPKDTPRGYGVEIIIPTDDIEALFVLFQRLHPKNLVTPISHAHSHRDFRAVDPFGYYLRFVERYNWVDGRDKEGKVIEHE